MREYRAKSAPLTASGRSTSAKTGLSRLGEMRGEDRALVVGERLGRVPDAHGVGLPVGDGEGDACSPVESVMVSPGLTCDPGAGFCAATLFVLGHCGSGGTSGPGTTTNPMCSSWLFAEL